MNRSLLLVTLTGVLAVTVTGCNRDATRRNVQPGAMDEVYARSGATGAAGGGSSAAQYIGVTLDYGYTPEPEIAEMKRAKLMYVWIKPMQSTDGLTMREGVWAKTVLSPYGFTEIEAANTIVPFAVGSSLVGEELPSGQVPGAVQTPARLPSAFIDTMRGAIGSAMESPWSEQQVQSEQPAPQSR